MILAVFALLALTPARADPTSERPPEESMFGESAPAPTFRPGPAPSAVAPKTGLAIPESVPNVPTPGPAPAFPPAVPATDDVRAMDPTAPGRDAFASGEVSDNPLQIGGVYYQRMTVSASRGGSAASTPLALPLQFDGFLDTRPSDRLRGYVDARLFYDASRDNYSRATGGSSAGSLQFSSTSSAPSSLSTFTATPNNPAVALDQAWLKFDLARTIFVTVGRQHVKWGSGHFWNPTDLLSTQRRDPLLPYDLRLGNSMVKLGIPMEGSQSNLTAIALLDNPLPASTLGQVGGAFRAESVVLGAEVGLDFIARNGGGPVFGADVSTGLGPLDFYAEAAVVGQAPHSRLDYSAAPTPGADLSKIFSTSDPPGPFLQFTTGADYQFGWRDNRIATVGAEYFYNQLGTDDGRTYPALLYLGQFQPFYTGRHYAAVYLNAEGPDAGKKTNYRLSTLGNVSDGSYVTRLDFSWLALTYLTFEAFGDVHFGTEGGEFNFSVHTPALTYQGNGIPATEISGTIFDLGIGLRIGF